MIDEKEFIADIEKRYCEPCKKTESDWGGNKCRICWVDDMMCEIESASTVDAEPVKHSEWKYYHKKGVAVCKNCSFERDLNTDFGRAVSCPNCGAKMEAK